MQTLVAIRRSAGPALPLGFTGAALAHDESAEITNLRRRIEQLKASSSSDLSFGLPGSTTVEIYGYAKLDQIFDLDSDLETTIFGPADLEPGFASDSNSWAHAF